MKYSRFSLIFCWTKGSVYNLNNQTYLLTICFKQANFARYVMNIANNEHCDQTHCLFDHSASLNI